MNVGGWCFALVESRMSRSGGNLRSRDESTNEALRACGRSLLADNHIRQIRG